MRETVTINGRAFPVASWGAAPATVKRKAHRVIPKPLDSGPVSRGTLTLSMPPPSVNALFANAKKGRRKTLAYRNWRAFADRELRDQPSWHVPGKVRVLIRVGGSRADCDNLCKAPIDALVGAGRIQDDRNVVDVRAIHDDGVTGTVIEIEAAA